MGSLLYFFFSISPEAFSFLPSSSKYFSSKAICFYLFCWFVEMDGFFDVWEIFLTKSNQRILYFPLSCPNFPYFLLQNLFPFPELSSHGPLHVVSNLRWYHMHITCISHAQKKRIGFIRKCNNEIPPQSDFADSTNPRKHA
eukprot:Sdes_comp20005_c0_seq1m12656